MPTSVRLIRLVGLHVIVKLVFISGVVSLSLVDRPGLAQRVEYPPRRVAPCFYSSPDRTNSVCREEALVPCQTLNTAPLRALKGSLLTFNERLQQFDVAEVTATASARLHSSSSAIHLFTVTRSL